MFALDIEIPDLQDQLRRLVRQVPPGRVATYGDLALALGDWRAARWIGGALNETDVRDEAPVHRILRATGELARSAQDTPSEQARLLRSEGLPIDGDRLDLEAYRFRDLEGPRPLKRLAEYQEQLHERVQLAPLDELPDVVAGVDVSYASDRRAVAAYVLVETATAQRVWSTTEVLPATFPYITGYLTFRELPVLLAVLNSAAAAGRLAPVILVDGSGILHPRGAGIATNFGVVTGLASIGISKTLLSGRVDVEDMTPGESRPIDHHGEVRGMAIKAVKRGRPVYVSPGHNMDVAGALQVVQRVFRGHRLPEPTFHADAISRQAARALAAQGNTLPLSD